MTATDFAEVSGLLFGAYALGLASGLMWMWVKKAMELL